jgi:hypothetical protein
MAGDGGGQREEGVVGDWREDVPAYDLLSKNQLFKIKINAF